eukprot:19349_1
MIVQSLFIYSIRLFISNTICSNIILLCIYIIPNTTDSIINKVNLNIIQLSIVYYCNVIANCSISQPIIIYIISIVFYIIDVMANYNINQPIIIYITSNRTVLITDFNFSEFSLHFIIYIINLIINLIINIINLNIIQLSMYNKNVAYFITNIIIQFYIFIIANRTYLTGE